jgi:hypothetical protein
MAVLYITEYNQNRADPFGPQAADEPPVAEQTLAIGGSSVASAAFNPATNLVRLQADETCAISFGTSPTAQTASGTETGNSAVGTQRIAAGVTEFKNIKPGLSLKVAVIATS